MKSILLSLLLTGIGAISSRAQSNPSPVENDIKMLIARIEKAASESNADELDQLLHPDYRVIANWFKGGSGTTIISKSQYLGMVRTGTVGGTSYTTEYQSISITDHTAQVELWYRSGESADMHKYLLLVQDEDDRWKVISDLPMVQP